MVLFHFYCNSFSFDDNFSVNIVGITNVRVDYKTMNMWSALLENHIAKGKLEV